jgi:hypothetical protein
LENIWKVLSSKATIVKLAISEEDLQTLQDNSLLRSRSQDEVTNIWKELSERCPPLDPSTSARSSENSKEDSFEFDVSQRYNTNPSVDVCVAYAEPSGRPLAR